MLQFGKQLKRKSLLGKTSCHVSTEVIPPPVLNQGARKGRLSKMLQKSLQSGKRMFGESLFQKLLNLVVYNEQGDNQLLKANILQECKDWFGPPRFQLVVIWCFLPLICYPVVQDRCVYPENILCSMDNPVYT